MAGVELKKFMFDREFDDLKPKSKPAKADEVGSTGTAAPDSAGSEGDAPVDVADTPQPPEPEPEPEVTFREVDVAQAHDEGFRAGRDEALKDLEGSLKQKQVDTLEALTRKLDGIFDAHEADIEAHHRNSVAVASVIVRKLFPALNNEKAIDEIVHIIDDSMSRTSSQTWITFYVAQDLKAETERLLAEKVTLNGREGIGLKVVGQPDMPYGDCRVEWEGGGMTRDQEELWREIDEIIERNLGVSLPRPSVKSGADPYVGPDMQSEVPPAGEVETLNAPGISGPDKATSIADDGDAKPERP